MSYLLDHKPIWFSDLSSRPQPKEQCNCDCACSATETKPHDYSINQIVSAINGKQINQIKVNPDLIVVPVNSYVALLSATNNKLVLLDEELYRKIQRDRPTCLDDLLKLFSDWNPCHAKQIVALLLAANILVSNAVPINAELVSSRALTVWLQLTSNCNLDCSYCFVRRTKQSMSIDIAIRAVDAIFRSIRLHDCQRLKMKFSGGEPSMNFQVLKVVQEYIESLALNMNVEYESVILTNGVDLDCKQIEFLSKHNIGVMVSMDGLGYFQDVHRKRANTDSSTYERVTETLQNLIQHGILPHISVTLTKQSLPGLPNFIEYLLQRELHFSLNFYRPIHNYETDMLCPSNQELNSSLLAVFARIEKALPAYSLFTNLTDRANASFIHTRACGAGQSYLTIFCDGAISKCQMEQESLITTIDDLDPLTTVVLSPSNPVNLLVDQKSCVDCLWRYRCAGGCPKLSENYYGSPVVRSPLCSVYQATLPKSVRLESLRMMKYEDPWNFETAGGI